MRAPSARRLVGLALAVLAAGAGAAGLVAGGRAGRADGADGAAADARPGRVFLLGVDGLDPDIADEFLRRGDLPNLARLVDGRSVARLRVVSGLSPLSWTRGRVDSTYSPVPLRR